MQGFGGLFAVAGEAVEGGFDQLAFHFGECQAWQGVGFFFGHFAGGEPRFDDRGGQLGSPVQGTGSFNDVFEFADVTRPFVTLQHVQCVQGQRAWWSAFSSGDSTEEVFGEWGDVVFARSQRRQVDAGLRSFFVQVASEQALVDQADEIDVGTEDESDVESDSFAGLRMDEALLANQRGNLLLHWESDELNLFEQQGSAVGKFESAGMANRLTQGSWFALTEQVLFECFSRQDAAIDFDEWSVSSAARIVDGLGDEIRSRAWFTLNQDAASAVGNGLYLLSQGVHGGAVTNHVSQVAIAELAAEAAVFGHQLGSLNGTGQRQREGRRGVWLCQEFDAVGGWQDLRSIVRGSGDEADQLSRPTLLLDQSGDRARGFARSQRSDEADLASLQAERLGSRFVGVDYAGRETCRSDIVLEPPGCFLIAGDDQDIGGGFHDRCRSTLWERDHIGMGSRHAVTMIGKGRCAKSVRTLDGPQNACLR